MKTFPWQSPATEANNQNPDVAQATYAATAAPTEELRVLPSGNVISNKTGRFVKGMGRRRGSKNKVTIAIENMMEGEAEVITRRCIDLAKNGDPTALRIVMDRIAPVRKGRPLHGIDRKDGENSIEALLRAVLDGEITPEEGKDVVGLIESAARVAAAKALTEMRQQQLDAIKKVTDAGGVPGGVMLVPMLSGDDWNTFAVAGQQQLKLTVRN